MAGTAAIEERLRAVEDNSCTFLGGCMDTHGDFHRENLRDRESPPRIRAEAGSPPLEEGAENEPRRSWRPCHGGARPAHRTVVRFGSGWGRSSAPFAAVPPVRDRCSASMSTPPFGGAASSTTGQLGGSSTPAPGHALQIYPHAERCGEIAQRSEGRRHACVIGIVAADAQPLRPERAGCLQDRREGGRDEVPESVTNSMS